MTTNYSHRLRTYRLFAVLFLHIVCQHVSCFVSPRILSPTLAGTGGSQRLWESQTENFQETVNGEEKPQRTESLIFSAAINLSSDAFPPGTTKADMLAFLQEPDTRNYLLSSGGARPVQEVPMSPELESLWKEYCQQEYGVDNLPEAGDCVLGCENSVQFPGIKMRTTVYNGVKFRTTDAGLPEYSFFLIGEKQTVTGLPPAVYIFNKLTGADKKEDSLKPSGVARCIVSVLENDNDESLVLNFNANIKLTIEFPAFLLIILPTNKEKVEAQGSKSVLKSVKPTVEQSTKGVMDIFKAFQQEANP